jgi:hypothetical protein
VRRRPTFAKKATYDAAEAYLCREHMTYTPSREQILSREHILYIYLENTFYNAAEATQPSKKEWVA